MVFPAVRARVRLLGTLARILRSAQDDKLGRFGLAARRLGTNVAALTCHSEPRRRCAAKNVGGVPRKPRSDKKRKK